jgi:hypothetical protein
LILEIAILIFSTNMEHQDQYEFIVGYHLNLEMKTWAQFPTEFEPNYFRNRSAQNIWLTINHAERFRRTVNNKCGKKTCILRKIHNLQANIIRRIYHFNSFPVRRQLHEHIQRLQRKAA